MQPDNVDYRLLDYWNALRRPALYAATADEGPAEFEAKLNALLDRIDERRIEPGAKIYHLPCGR
jgi:hypothetical protein